MNLRKFRRDDVSVNLTPLIDVVFLLLIFFMVTMSFRDESEIQINLPQASDKPMEVKEEAMELLIDKDGNYYIDRKKVVNTQINTLKRALRASRGDRKSPPLIISADAMAPHQSVVKAMDAARQVGLIKLSIATKNLSNK